MGGLFSRKPTSRVTEGDVAVLKLKNQRDRLRRYQMNLEEVLHRDRVIARELLIRGDKDRALLLLKKKRYTHQLMRNIHNQLVTLEKLVDDIELAQIQTKVVEGLKQGNDALKRLNEAMNIEDIEQMLDETRDAKDKQDEISNLFSGRLTQEDEDAVENELQSIINEELKEESYTESDDSEKRADEVKRSKEEPEEVKEEPKKKEKAKKSKPKEAVALEA